jgi:ABC-type Fe3+/spermidine/putrescine transport system ATPase subunit
MRMCFASQTCALFSHLNFQKCSENLVCFVPQRLALIPHLNVQKWSETVSFEHY